MGVKERNDIVEKNIGLARFCAKKFINKGIEFDDIYQVACVGLVKASKAFDDMRGVKFSTYAVSVIFGEIKQLFRSNSQISASRSLKDLLLKINKEREEFIKVNGCEPTINELSYKIEVETEKIIEALNFQKPTLSLEFCDESEIFDSASIFKFEEMTSNIVVKKILENLGKKDRDIINLRFFHHMTQSEVARNLGTTQIQISRRERIILKILKNELKAN
ncbi:MAG: sigma-70 family RNA polymerase sigma factor [Candidatus Improbicoccus pseudotrichonymphae]|uniref:Sigma-70 family RNA polymerase sigma factor n=1 Tax=Candidatus Improbicoccus pseudotrichonymphae TaxID=3033792 RepID=A0AA48HXH6_9FIRM|nr:MAG: sigma-70 family RNA polymerase sigma factor [Candidatus Improbicoccus pseudotrichonymphae]